MLQIPDLDNITYEQLLENAIHKIPQLTKEWTDFNVHDPGITTLEIHAWLIDMLNYYINASGDVHTYKYMKLLGITPMKSRTARTWVSMEPGESGVQVIPKDFPVYAGNKSFVTAQNTVIHENHFQGLYRQVGDRITDLTEFAGKGGKFVHVFDPEADDIETVYLKFEKVLEGDVELFVTVKEQENCEQLPEDLYLSVLKLYYFDGSDWKSAQIRKDGTNGLLRSGVISFTVNQKMREFHQDNLSGALLKLVLEDNQFDAAPEFGEVYLNPVRMIQKENLVRRTEYVLHAGETEISLKEYLAENETVRIGLKDGEADQWILLEETVRDHAPQYHIDRLQNRIIFEPEYLSDRDHQIDVFMVREDVEGSLVIGNTDGCVGQEYELFTDNPCETEIIIGKEVDGKLIYRKWEFMDELEKASGRDPVYTLDGSNRVIRFGDGIHGMVPEEGNLVIVSTLAVSDFEEGNVRAGEIRNIRDARFAGISVNNFAAAAGGRREETLDEMQVRLERQVETQKRLVSPADYEEQVKKIPGLKIKAAKVVPAAGYCRSHGLTVLPYDVWLVVCPEKQDHRKTLSKQYEDAILKWMEPYRMLGTRIRVAAPSYTGIQISGKIRIQGDKVSAGKEIGGFLEKYIGEYEENCRFGATLSHGDIFMKLEALDCVEKVEELHLSPGGKNAVRNDRGDILLAEDCLPFVGDIVFELNNHLD